MRQKYSIGHKQQQAVTDMLQCVVDSCTMQNPECLSGNEIMFVFLGRSTLMYVIGLLETMG